MAHFSALHNTFSSGLVTRLVTSESSPLKKSKSHFADVLCFKGHIVELQVSLSSNLDLFLPFKLVLRKAEY